MSSSNNNSIVNLDNLKSALDDSSDKNRNFMVAFLVLELYLLITILSITDRDLFMPDSVLNLPFFAVNISLIGFVILAPVLLLAFHYNLLFNLLEHARTLREWLDHPDNDRAANFNLLHAFMLNTRAKYDKYEAIGKNKEQTRTVNYYLLNIIIIGIMSVLPLYLLVLIMWKIADYQNYYITIWHSFLIAGSVLLHILYWSRIQYPKLLNNDMNSYDNLFSNLKVCKTEFIYIGFAILLVLFRFFALVATEAPSFLHPLKAYPKLNWLVPHLDVSGEIFLPLAEQANRGSNILNSVSNKMTLAESQQVLGTTIITEDAEKRLQSYIAKSAALDDWEKNCYDRRSIAQIKLGERPLRLANLNNVVICNVDMTNADLRGASFDYAIIDGVLANARLNNTSMKHTRLQSGSKLTGANLENANLTFAEFNGVDLTLAEAREATFFGTLLVDAIMVQTNLSQAVFTHTDLFRASMRSANLERAIFRSTNLLATDIRFVTGLRDTKQLIESPIKNCRVDWKVILPIMEIFEQANCKITHDNEYYNTQYAKSQDRIYTFSFKKADYNKVEHVLESTSDLVNNIIEITRLTKSIKIDLSGYDLSEIPSSLFVLSNLEELDLANNNLTSYQLSLLVEYLPKLKKLNLDSNELTALPESIGELNQLISLNLFSNQLKVLPKSLGQLSQLAELDVGRNDLTALPESFAQLKQLQSLTLSENELSELPESIGQLSQLTILDLGANQLTELPESFEKLDRLTALDVGENQLSSLPKFITNLKQLTLLDIGYNNLTELPASFSQLRNLTDLDLSNNYITALPEHFSMLSQLSFLDLRRNKLTSLPKSFGQLRQLTSLALGNGQINMLPETVDQLKQPINIEHSHFPPDFADSEYAGNNLVSLPEAFGQLTSLQRLDLSSSQLEELPESFSLLYQLTSLDLSSNNLTTLPESVTNLTQLTSLVLSSNNLTTLPESVTNLTQLTNLVLNHNQLTKLPASIFRLDSLTKLDIGYNQLTELPISVFWMRGLNSLVLSGNKLTKLPLFVISSRLMQHFSLNKNDLTESSYSLSGLTSLDLSNNKLTELPESVSRISSLTSLNLSYNQLTKLPEAVTRISSLTSLDLSNNRLTELPESVSRISSLTSLDLSNNQLSSLPDIFGQLSQLKELNLNSNQLKILPKSVCSFYGNRYPMYYIKGNNFVTIPEDCWHQN
jgi:Leucine-rich repeat (LRR) protein